MSEFVLHSKLEADTFEIADLEVSQLLLMNDARFPWLILVPRVSDMRDLHNLPKDHYQVGNKRNSPCISNFADSDPSAQDERGRIGQHGAPTTHSHYRQTNR